MATPAVPRGVLCPVADRKPRRSLSRWRLKPYGTDIDGASLDKRSMLAGKSRAACEALRLRGLLR